MQVQGVQCQQGGVQYEGVCNVSEGAQDVAALSMHTASTLFDVRNCSQDVALRTFGAPFVDARTTATAASTASLPSAVGVQVGTSDPVLMRCRGDENGSGLVPRPDERPAFPLDLDALRAHERVGVCNASEGAHDASEGACDAGKGVRGSEWYLNLLPITELCIYKCERDSDVHMPKMG